MFFACLKRRRSIGAIKLQRHEMHTRVSQQTMTHTQETQTSSAPEDGWAVFWDFENMALWKRYRSVGDIIKHIHACLFAISKSSSVAPHVAQFYGIGKISKMPTDVLQRLEQLGIKALNSPSRQKNSADIMIVTEVMKCLIKTPPQGVCLITNDGDFSHCMQTVAELGYTTALLHDNPSKALARTVRNSIDLSSTYTRKSTGYSKNRKSGSVRSGGSETSVRSAVTEPLPAYVRNTAPDTYSLTEAKPQETGITTRTRPGLTHLLRILELSGGCLWFSELKRQMGQLPVGWLSNLLESGTSQRRLRVYGSWVILMSSQHMLLNPNRHFYYHGFHERPRPLFLHQYHNQLGNARA